MSEALRLEHTCSAQEIQGDITTLCVPYNKWERQFVQCTSRLCNVRTGAQKQTSSFHALILRFTFPLRPPARGVGNVSSLVVMFFGGLLYEGNCGYRTKQSQMQHIGEKTICAYGWHLHCRPTFQCLSDNCNCMLCSGAVPVTRQRQTKHTLNSKSEFFGGL